MDFCEAVSMAFERPGRNIRARCPIHAGKSRSLSVCYDNGRVLFHCFAGCSSTDLLQYSNIEGLPHREKQFVRPISIDDGNAQRNNDLWFAASIPITRGDPVNTYLRARAIELATFPDTLRYCPRAYCRLECDVAHLPAMIARVDSPDGELVSVHRTYLKPDGVGKANIEAPKRMTPCSWPGATKGGAIRLFPPGPTLGLAEGIETALAAHTLSGLPIWSAISAGGLENIILPRETLEVIIYGDADLRGKEAALALKRRLEVEGRSVKVQIPAEEGRDWNDLLIDSRRKSHERNHSTTSGSL